MLTQTGIKAFMIEKGLLPKIEKSSKAEESDEEAVDIPTAEDSAE